MKRLLVLLALLMPLASFAQKFDFTKVTIAKDGNTAPQFTLEAYDGPAVSLANLKGKVVLITFWATWCPPCCNELLPQCLPTTVKQFEGKDFVWLPIEKGEKRSKVDAFFKNEEYAAAYDYLKKITLLDVDEKVYKSYAKQYIPRNFVIGKDGKVVYWSVGFTPNDTESEERLVEAIKKALE